MKPNTRLRNWRQNNKVDERMVEFSGNGKPYQGYLSRSRSGVGPGVIVIQEWWGLVGHIKDVADRFAAEGFTALAPDFYHGKEAAEPDEAGSLMMALNIDDAAKVIRGAIDYLVANDGVESEIVGVIGFCMGGQLSMFAAGLDPRIAACVNFYGIHPNVHPDFANVAAPILGIFAEKDDYASPEAVAALDAKLSELGKAHEFHTFPGTQHAFFNEDRPQVYDGTAARASWEIVMGFLRANLTP